VALKQAKVERGFTEIWKGHTGFNSYTDPEATSVSMWSAATNVYSGLFGAVRRARTATIVRATVTTGFPTQASNSFQTLYPFRSGSANSVPIKSAVRVGVATTITTTKQHGFMIGDSVTIAGVTGGAISFNGTFAITTINAAAFTFGYTQSSGSESGDPNTGTATVGSFDNILGDVGTGRMFSFETSAYTAQQRFNPYVDPSGSGLTSLLGPWMRTSLLNQSYEMNGTVKQKGRGPHATAIDSFGLDAPDAAPVVNATAEVDVIMTISAISRTNNVVTVTIAPSHGLMIPQFVTIAGVSNATFNGTFQVATIPNNTTITYPQVGLNVASSGGTVGAITTTGIGRSWTYAWEDAINGHISAPAPVTPYTVLSATAKNIFIVNSGLVSTTIGSPTVVGTTDPVYGTPAFTAAWIGRSLWTVDGNYGRIIAVADASHMTLATPAPSTQPPRRFIIVDPRVTHIRVYATGDGGTTYFRIARVAVDPSNNTGHFFLNASDVVTDFFTDALNTQPPATGWTTSEQPQFFNVPPPIGLFIHEYQARNIVYGVTAALQTFFYSNQEFTGFGSPPESFAPLNQVTLPISGAKINGMASLPTGLVIWSDKRDMFKLTGVLVDNNVTTDVNIGSSIQRLPYDLGCVSPYATAVTPLGVFWVTSDLEVRLFTDNHAPRNIGRPIQNELQKVASTSRSKIRLTYYRVRDHNWLCLSFQTPNANQDANLMFLLDIDILEAAGERGSYIFNETVSQPTWYRYDANQMGAGYDFLTIVSAYDSVTKVSRLVSGGLGAQDGLGQTQSSIFDLDFNGTDFKISEEAVGGNFTTHAWGNKDAEVIKDIAWARFSTNRTSAQLASDGWVFTFLGIDDDVSTFASPLSLTLTPGANDAATQMGTLGGSSSGRQFEYGTGLFRLKGATITGGVATQRIMRGRRIKLTITFPSTAGTAYEYRGVMITGSKYQPR